MSNFLHRCLVLEVQPSLHRSRARSPLVAAWSASLLLGCSAHEILFVDGPIETEGMPNEAAPPPEPALPPVGSPPVSEPAGPAAMPPAAAPLGSGSSAPPVAGSPPGASAGGPPPAVAPSPEPPEPPEPCAAFGAFGEPELITGLGLTAQTLGPVFSADGLTMFFSVLGDGAGAADENIFSAQRTRGSSQFSPATQVPNLDAGGSEEGTPFLSFDGRSLYFFSTRPGPGAQGGRDIWLAQRPTPAAPFEEPAVLPGINGPELEHLPRLSRDELSILFVSSRDSPNGATNLWIAQRASRSDEFAAPVEVPGINGDAREEGFSLSSDGLTLFFASSRVDLEQMDLFVATRPDGEASFATPEPLDVLNSASDDLDPQLSPDGLELFFASSRAGSFQLFRASRECDTP